MRAAAILPALAAFSMLLTSTASAASPQVSATHPLIKVRPNDVPPKEAVARIAGASNEMEGFQAVIEGGSEGLRGVSARVTDLEGPTTIEASRFVLYRQEYMEIRERSDANAMDGLVPDALIPDVDPLVGEKRNAFPFDVPPGENRVLWVDLHIPPNTPAGVYEGLLEVEAEGFFEVLPIELEVFPFELPSTPSYTTAFGFGWSSTGTAHCGEAWCNGDDALYDRLRQLYAIAALDNRISLSSVAGPGVPGSGGSLDFSRFDRVVGPLLDGTADTRLEGAQLTSVQTWMRERSPENYAAWTAHFQERGWLDRVFDYTCDEPPLGCAFEEIPAKQQSIRTGTSEIPSLITTSIQRLNEYGLYENTDLIVPVVNFVQGKSGDYAGDQSALYEKARAEGKTTWIYSSCMSHGCGGTVGGEYEVDHDLSGWPSLVIDHSALRNRAMPWVAYRFGFTGELYWETVWAHTSQGNPWVSQWDFTGNGDGTLFYPGSPARIGGTTDIPIESLRMKHIRDGIEDYEYLKILESVDPEGAKEFATALFPNAWSAADIEPEQLLETRRALAERIAGEPGARAPRRTAVAHSGFGGKPVGAEGAGGCHAAGAAAPSALAWLLAPLALVALPRRSR